MGVNLGPRATNPKKAEVWRRLDRMCRWCLYDKLADGNWVQQVEACTADDCPLYPLRRVSTSKRAKK